MNDRTIRALGPVYVLIGLVLAASIPAYGWWIVLPLVCDVIKGNVINTAMKHAERPDLLCAFDQYSSIVFVGIGIYLTGGASSPFLPLLALHGAIFPVVFSRRFMRAGGAALVTTILLASLGPARPAEYEGFYRLGTVLVVVLGTWIISRELKRSELSFRSASLVDELTGLPNRRAFDDHYDAILQRLFLRPEPAALIVCDIDFFKKVNDVHGHDVGDDVLAQIGDELASSFRASDGIYRIGGEEFACILQGVPEEMAYVMAGALRDRIAVTMPAGLEVTMSFGVATTTGGENGDDLFRRADQALLEAKRTGRNKVVMARPPSDLAADETASALQSPTARQFANLLQPAISVSEPIESTSSKVDGSAPGER